MTGEAAARSPASGAELTVKDWLNKGIALANLARPEEALACFDRALEINPREAMA